MKVILKKHYKVLKKLSEGNSSREMTVNIDYETKLERVFGKQNVNVLYWVDKVGSIYGYSVGMGNAVPKATFVIVDVVKGNLLINGDYSSIEDYKILPKNLISHNKDRLSCETKAQCKKFQANKYYLLNKTKVRKIIYILAFILIIFFAYKIFLKIRKK